MNDIKVLHKLGKENTYHIGLTSNESSPDSIKFKTPFENVIAVEVIQSEIPYCDYTIDEFRNNFTIDSSGITLATGDYNVLQLANELQTKIRTALGGSTDFNVTIDTSFMRLTFSWLSNSFIIKPGELSDILGIMKDTTTSNGTIESIHPINLKPDQIISIHCDELDSIITKGKSEDPMVTRLSEQVIRNINTGGFEVVPFIRPFFPISRLSQLTLKFKRRDGTLYDFKGRSWYLKLIIQTLDMTYNEDHNNIEHVIKAPVSNPYILPFAANYYNE